MNVGNQHNGEALVSDTSLKHFYLEVKPTEINEIIHLMSDGPILQRSKTQHWFVRDAKYSEAVGCLFGK